MVCNKTDPSFCYFLPNWDAKHMLFFLALEGKTCLSVKLNHALKQTAHFKTKMESLMLDILPSVQANHRPAVLVNIL